MKCIGHKLPVFVYTFPEDPLNAENQFFKGLPSFFFPVDLKSLAIGDTYTTYIQTVL